MNIHALEATGGYSLFMRPDTCPDCGEPTLMGLNFFERTVELQKKYQKPRTRIENTFQTNGILVNQDWCRFFHRNNFLVGLSLDGPRELHDFYRKDMGGRGTFERVLRAARLLHRSRYRECGQHNAQLVRANAG